MSDLSKVFRPADILEFFRVFKGIGKSGFCEISIYRSVFTLSSDHNMLMFALYYFQCWRKFVFLADLLYILANLNRHIVASGTSFGLGVRVSVNPPITNRNLFCDGEVPFI